MKKSYPKIYLLFLSFVLILQLIFLYYIKYQNQGLTLDEFSLANIGNIFNLVITLAIIIGVAIYLTKNSSASRQIIFFIIILFFSLIVTYILTFIVFPPGDLYFLNRTEDKIIDAAMFTIFQFIQFTILSFIWLKVFDSDRMVLFRSFVNAVLAMVFFLILTYLYIQTRGYSSNNWALTKSSKNISVVLGAAVWSDNQPSPSLSNRVDRAIELQDEGYTGRILLTGGNAPGEHSEAQVAFEYAKQKGIDTSIVQIESLTTSTSEQILYIKRNLVSNKNIENIIIVSDAYHLIRVLEISKFYNINIKVAASKLRLNYEQKLYWQIRESIALIVFWSFAL
jgi:vancomycin permeability regulator SanA